MADENLEIKISTEFDGKGADKATKELKNVEKQSENTFKSLDKFRKIDVFAHFTQGLTNSIALLSKMGSVIKSAFGGLAGVFGDGVRLNAEFETLNQRLQSLIFTADKSSSADPFAKWQQSGEKAKGVVEELKNLSKELGYSNSDMAGMFSSFYSTASQSMDLNTATEVFKKIAAAAKASGADVGSLKATLDSLGAGIVQTTTDFGRFASGLGLSTESLKQAIANGNFAEVLMNAFAPFEDAAKMAEMTYDKIKEQFIATLDEMKMYAAEPIFDALKQSFENLNEALKIDGDVSSALRSVGDELGKIINDTLTPENIRASAEALSAIVSVLGDFISLARGISDIAAPDWLMGKDAGLTSYIVGWEQSLKDFKSNVKTLFGNIDTKALRDIEKEVFYTTNKIKDSFTSVGAIEIGGKFDGFQSGIKGSLEDIEKIRQALLKRQSELDALRAKIMNLGWGEQQKAENSGLLANIENETQRVRTALMSLYQWEGIPKLQEEAQNAKALADETARLKMEEQTRLETYLKANETRFKNYEKTIERLMSEEEKLTAKLQDGVAQREAIENAYNDKRAGISGEYDEKIRKSNQYNLSDSAKFALDMQQYTKSVLEAKKALEVGDLSGFERYLSLAKELSNAWADKSGKELKENEFDIVGIELYKKRLEELKALEISGTDEKEKKELAAHDEKMAQIQAELKATQDKITAEKAFYDEYTLKAKELQSLLNTDTNSEHNIDLNDSEAKAKIAELQKDTHSTHTVHVKEVRSGGMIAEKKATGGRILGLFRRRRGKIAGHDLSGSDDVPALLTRGEFVQNVRAVDYYGADFMEALNRRKIPKSALPKFATGGLVLSKFDKSLMRKITDNDPQVQELAKKLHEQFMREAGNSISKRFEVAKKWKNMYPDYFSVTSQNISWDFVGLAKMLIAKGVGKNADIASLGRGALGAFSGGGLVNMPNLGSQNTKSIDKNVNLNLNFGGKNSFAVQSDEATAMALERYLKGLGV